MERCLWRLGLYEKELDEKTIEDNKNKFKLKDSTMLYPIQETERKLSHGHAKSLVGRLYRVKREDSSQQNVRCFPNR
jgi:hypothetical protein